MDISPAAQYDNEKQLSMTTKETSMTILYKYDNKEVSMTRKQPSMTKKTTLQYDKKNNSITNKPLSF